MNEGIKSGSHKPAASAVEDVDLSDIPELDEFFFQHAEIRGPMVQLYSALVDRDVYEWFQLQGPDYLQRMNQVLREHMCEHQHAKADDSVQAQPRSR